MQKRSAAMMRNRVSITTLAVVCSACAPLLFERGSAPIGAERARLLALVESHYVSTFRAGDVPAWLALFGDDAVALHHNSPTLVGKPALYRFAEDFHERFTVEDMRVTVEEVRISGNWAFTWGRFVETFAAKDEPERHENAGRYLLLWEKQSDGHWRIIADMGNREGNG
jgi:uncharacterized protein (TIGR02246 family)